MNDNTIQPIRVTPAQHREVYISKNVQSDLDLWARIREYENGSRKKDLLKFFPRSNNKQRRNKC